MAPCISCHRSPIVISIVIITIHGHHHDVSHHHDVNICSDGSELEVTVGGEPIAAELPSGVRTGGIYTFGTGDVDDNNDGDDNDNNDDGY